MIGYTQIDPSFFDLSWSEYEATDGQVISLIAIRTCYSANKPTEIIEQEGYKYFMREARDEQGGTEADRLIRQIYVSKHTSTLEHLNFTFAVEGVSRSLLAQLTRHRHMSFSVQSQRYVKFGSDDKSGGFDYVMPPKVAVSNSSTIQKYVQTMESLQEAYDDLRSAGVPAEDARMILPNAARTNFIMTANLRSLVEFYDKRQHGKGAQWEIANLAELIKKEIIEAEPWTEAFFK